MQCLTKCTAMPSPTPSSQVLRPAITSGEQKPDCNGLHEATTALRALLELRGLNAYAALLQRPARCSSDAPSTPGFHSRRVCSSALLVACSLCTQTSRSVSGDESELYGDLSGFRILSLVAGASSIARLIGAPPVYRQSAIPASDAVQ